ncbi:MAG TPA: nucleoside triphosphate pyrophosphatase [Thermomicrobiales bacterium]|nr:nucleoside triphosphate pyrophosphatase [Thermomicrobiales bacterium]
MMTTLILASGSPRRRTFLELLGLEHEVVPAKIDEPEPGIVESPEAFARALARAKASVVASRNPGRPVLAADTVVSLDNRLLGKPADAAEAIAMLQLLRGRTHDVTTGVAVVDTEGRLRVGAATTRVTMRPYGDDEIEMTVRAGTPFDKAGGYAIQDQDFLPVAHFDGCYCNVVGLPLALAIDLLRQAGIEPPVTEPYRLLPYCLACPLFQRD